MTDVAPEGVRRIETVEAAKEVVDRWFAAWPKIIDLDTGDEIATCPTAKMQVSPNETSPRRWARFYEVSKGPERGYKGQTLVERRTISVHLSGSGVQEISMKAALYDESMDKDGQDGRVFISVVQEFLDEIEGVQGATEGSALPDENLPAVTEFQEKLEQIIPNLEEDSNGPDAQDE